MDGLRSYVVRLYRQERDAIAGVVESVETGETTAFRSPDELWAALQREPSRGGGPTVSADEGVSR